MEILHSYFYFNFLFIVNNVVRSTVLQTLGVWRKTTEILSKRPRDKKSTRITIVRRGDKSTTYTTSVVYIRWEDPVVGPSTANTTTEIVGYGHL